MNTQEAFKALETIQQSWAEDRIRSDLLPAIQSLRQIIFQHTQTKPVATLHRFPKNGLLNVEYTDEITDVPDGTHNLYIF
jgi:hypothetical protein